MKQLLTKNLALVLIAVAGIISTVGVTYAAISSYGNIYSPWVVDANPSTNYVSFGYRKSVVSGVNATTFAYRNDISVYDFTAANITESCANSYQEYYPTVTVTRTKINGEPKVMAGITGKPGCTYSLRFQVKDGTWYWIPWHGTDVQVIRGSVNGQLGVQIAPRQ